MSYKINRNHKDRLFCFIFGNEEHKEFALSLYNALNNSDYSNVDELEINTIDDVLYIRMKNDVSIMIDGNLSLYEQQSTYNPNMPLRGLLYFSRLYDKYILNNDFNIYSKKLIKIPTPKYVVFYNGVEQRPNEEKLKLSDAFINESYRGEFEWTATVINLGHKDNKSLMDRCEAMRIYSSITREIQKCKKDNKYETNVDTIIKRYINEGNILSDILLNHRSEVVDMVLTEFNEEQFIKWTKEEGREEGIEEGRKEGREELLEEVILGMIEEGLSYSAISRCLNNKYSISEIAEIARIAKNKKMEGLL